MFLIASVVSAAVNGLYCKNKVSSVALAVNVPVKSTPVIIVPITVGLTNVVPSYIKAAKTPWLPPPGVFVSIVRV